MSNLLMPLQIISNFTQFLLTIKLIVTIIRLLDNERLIIENV